MPQVSKVQRLNAEDKQWLDSELTRRGFSGYDELEELCRERGIDISSSSLHRYGQSFRDRVDAVKMITEQAKAVVESAPDDEGAVNEALMRLVQEKLFTFVIEAELGTDKMDLGKVARAIADLGRASVSQKRLAAEARQQALLDAANRVDTAAQERGLSAEDAKFWRERVLMGM